MPTATKPPIQLPIPQSQFVDKDGKPTKEFYDYIKSIDALIRAIRLEIP